MHHRHHFVAASILWALIAGLAAPLAHARVPSTGPRVDAARENTGTTVRAMFEAAGVRYPAHHFYIRVFKHDQELEVWAADKGEPLTLLTTYAICASSGVLGPKRRRGDLQVPEGFYAATWFNAQSSYHLSFLINYPNAADRILGYRPNLGGSILIHGDCVTIGCIPIEDGPVEELYPMALDTHLAGRPVVIHVFPTRLDEPGMRFLRKQAGSDAQLLAFWESLRPAYVAFEADQHIPRVRVHPKTGRYLIRP